MEPRFGRTFADVRIHTDARAAESARAVNAIAYAVGRDVVFAGGRFAPQTSDGRSLIAHELAHVIESTTHQSTGPIHIDNSMEDHADRLAASVMGGRAASSSAAITTGTSRALRRKPTNLPMWKERDDPDAEEQRQEAFAQIVSNRKQIREAAAKYNVPSAAIAGAIFWEALENPYSGYRPKSTRLGPGKVHPRDEADKVEAAGLVTQSKDIDEQVSRLRDIAWAIQYIAAIMRRHADVYKRIAGVDISADVGVLCTLYQGGKSEERAAKLAAKRKKDPTAMPAIGDDMAPWVLANLDTIKGWVEPPPRPH